MDEAIDLVVQTIVASKRIVALTGAGISTESGVPDFRGPQGLWKQVDPRISTIEFFREHPDEFWRFQLNRIKKIMEVQPNKGHYALAELEKMGKLSAIITQNVDGLHSKAGSKNVIELHGNIRIAKCVKCNKVVPIEEALKIIDEGIFPPTCRSCGGLFKTGTVLFNEPIPEEALAKAYIESENCDLMIVIGTSLRVYPAAYLPIVAKRRGAKVIIINMEPTPLDEVADIVIHNKAGDVLTAIVKKLREKVGARDSMTKC
ncbi:MAG: NAD-dependent protein deacetylase [Candidatus Nezhaarchaeota archaeon]|nr:NAD-dependent protein deacetylase [Candidatus Nezhaarchaeota archaeon]MCX8141824.1 NAD-dependent protein deacetylase [Candidatus Nezhaarchaeota archaeon]MDW8050395.1 NAD-dependent protein deacetylase [Nitrososphaerota archaeon]